MESDLLQELYELYASDVFRYARYAIGNRDDALDVLQDVFLKVHRSIGSFEGKSSPKTWLMTITRHTVADFFRTKARHEKHLVSLSDNQWVQIDASNSPFDELEIEQALNQLKDKERQAFVLRYVLGFSIKETAAAMEWTEVRVRVSIHRTNKKLRFLLQLEGMEGAVKNVKFE